MRDIKRTKKELIEELTLLRRRVSELEESLDAAEDGRPLRTHCILKDVTERQRDEDEIIRAREDWERTFDAVPDLVAILDDKYQIVRLNRAMAERLGVTAEEAVGLTCYEAVHNTSEPPDSCPHKCLLEDGKEHRIEIFEENLGGHFIVTTSPIKGPRGEIIGSVHVARDITERKRAEEALRKEAQRRSILMNGSRDGIAIIDQEHRVVEANPRFAEMLGYTPEELLGLNTWDWEAAMTEAEIRANFADLTRTDAIFETRHRRKDGTIYDAEVSASGAMVGDTPMVFTVSRNITKRKRSEEALKESEERYRTMLEAYDGLIYTCSKDYRVEFMNERFIERTGYDGTGEYCYKALHELDSICPWCVNEQVFQGETVRWEVQSPKDNRWYDIVNTPMYHPDGSVSKQAMIQDITDRKMAEEALKESEERYRTLVDNIELGIAYISADYEVMVANDYHHVLFDKEKGDHIGKKCYEEFEKRAEACPHCPGRESMSTGRSASVETEGVRDDGSRFQVLLRTFPVMGPGGKPTGFIEIVEDITYRKVAEDALKESEEKYRELVENANSIILRMDTQGKVTFFNEFAQTFFGFSRDEITGKNVVGTMVPETETTGRDLSAMILDIGKNPERYVTNENENTRKNGERVWVAWTNKAILDSDGQVSEILCVGNDITDRKRAQEALRVSEERFFKAFHSSPSITSISTLKDGRFKDVNESFTRILGYTEEEVIGRSSVELGILKPDERRRNVSLLEESGAFRNREFEYRVKSGEVRVGSFSQQVIELEGEQCLLTVVEDVTERKRAAERLHEQFEFLQKLIDTIPNPIFYKDVDGIFRGCNRAFEEYAGLPQEEIVGKSVYDIWPEELADVYFEADNKLFKEPGVLIYEAHLQYADGSYHDVIFNKATYTDARGELAGLVGVVMDITDHKRTQEALQESEHRFRTLADATFEGIAFHEKGLLLRANDQYFEMFGYEPEELLGKNAFPFTVTPESQRIMEDHIDAGHTGPYEVVGKRKDGTTFPLEIRAREMDLDGRVVRVGALRDVTERKSAEEALRESEQRYRAIAEDTPVMICRSLPNTEITYVNEAYCKYFKKSREELIGKPFLSLLPKENREAVAANLNALSVISPTLTHEHPVIAPDGRIGWQQWTNRALFDSRGKVIAFQSIGEDITSRRRAEEALRESEERYRSMMEAMDDFVYICSPDLRVEYMNPAMVDHVGRDATGEPCYEVIHGLSEKCPWCVYEKVQEGEYYKHEVKSPKDGRSYIVSNSPIFKPDGSISKMTVFRDITDQLRMEEERKELEAKYHHAQKLEAIGTLAGGIAHDFNNILAAILGCTELAIKETPREGTMWQDLSNVLEAGRRARDLTKQILTFSHRAESKMEAVYLSDLVIESQKLLRPSLPTSIDIRYSLEAAPNKVLADPVQIQQVIMNLCTNSAHAMREKGGVLELSLADIEFDSEEARQHLDLEPGPYIRLTVSDTGHGMSSEVMERIFDPYFTTKKPGEGTGLGLSTVHGIARGHKGAITVESELGVGTTFHMYIPKIEAVAEPTTGEAEPIKGGDERILVVDDEKALAYIWKKALESLGYDVFSTTSSSRARSAFFNQPDGFDLVIMDQTMPGMIGTELALEILGVKPDLPIILCTGYSDLVNEEKAKSIGIKEFMMKPIETDNLARTVRRLLDERS